MITNIEIVATGGVELDNDIKKYINQKIGRLDRFMNKKVRQSVSVEVKLKQEQSKKKDKMTAEVVLKVPGETIVAKESTLNIYAALDIVEAKLKNQLRKYKEKHGVHNKRSNRKGVLRRIRSLADKDHWGSQN